MADLGCRCGRLVMRWCTCTLLRCQPVNLSVIEQVRSVVDQLCHCSSEDRSTEGHFGLQHMGSSGPVWFEIHFLISVWYGMLGITPFSSHRKVSCSSCVHAPHVMAESSQAAQRSFCFVAYSSSKTSRLTINANSRVLGFI